MVVRLISGDVEGLGKRRVVEFGESLHFRPVGENNAMRGGDQRMLRGVHVGTIRHEERSREVWVHRRVSSAHAVGVRHAQCEGSHDDRCRNRIGELMAEDDDQRQVERVSSGTVPEVEIPRPEAGEERW